MNTKEAIEFLKCIGRDYYAEAGKDKIIDLLKYGEKFEHMWKELDEYIKPDNWKHKNKRNKVKSVYEEHIEMIKKMEELEQKYSPKVLNRK